MDAKGKTDSETLQQKGDQGGRRVGNQQLRQGRNDHGGHNPGGQKVAMSCADAGNEWRDGCRGIWNKRVGSDRRPGSSGRS